MEIKKEIIDKLGQKICNKLKIKNGVTITVEEGIKDITLHHHTMGEYTFNVNDKSMALKQFCDIQKDAVIEEELQLYMVKKYPEMFSWVQKKNTAAIKLMLNTLDKEWYKKSCFMQSVDLDEISHFDKDMIKNALPGLDINNGLDEEAKLNIKKRLDSLVKLPAFKDITKEEQKDILKYNPEALIYFNKQDSELQDIALRDKKGNYSCERFYAFPSCILINKDIILNIINNYECFIKSPPYSDAFFFIDQVMNKCKKEDKNYIIEEVYKSSIEFGMEHFNIWSSEYDTKSDDSLYNKVLENFILQKKKTMPVNVFEYWLEPEEENLLFHMESCETINKQNIINLIVTIPNILYSTSFQKYLNNKYFSVAHDKELEQIPKKELKYISSEVIKQRPAILMMKSNYIIPSEDAIAEVIEKAPSYITWVDKPSARICAVAFEKEPTLYSEIYQYADIDTMIKAIQYNPSNIVYATKLKLFSNSLYKLALSTTKKNNDQRSLHFCELYHKDMVKYQEMIKEIKEKAIVKRKLAHPKVNK